MKKFLFLSLLGLPLVFLGGCSLINNNDSGINTGDLEKISQLEQQLSGLIEQFSGLQAENESLKETLSGSLVSIQTLKSENEILQADVDKYKKMIVEDKLNSKNTKNTNNTTSSTNNTTSQKNLGYITEVYTNGGKKYLKIDYIEYGATGPGGAPEIINNNPLIRTFEIDNNATFIIQKQILVKPNVWMDAYTQSDGISNREEFIYWANNDSKFLYDNCEPNENDEWRRCSINYYVGGGKEAIVEITHDGQKIYKIEQLYRP